VVSIQEIHEFVVDTENVLIKMIVVVIVVGTEPGAVTLLHRLLAVINHTTTQKFALIMELVRETIFACVREVGVDFVVIK